MSTERDAIEKQVAEELGFRVVNPKIAGIGHVPEFVEGDGESDTDYIADGRHWALFDALVAARLKLAGVERERDKAIKGQESTWKWLESKYGKLDEWSRTILPEPWRTQFWNCRANGLYDQTKDEGEPYRCNAGMMITPSNYFHLKEPQILYDQIARAESASLKLAAADRLAEAAQEWVLISGGSKLVSAAENMDAYVALRSALLEYSRTKV